MKIDIVKLYEDFNIPIAPTNHKHCTEGWVNTICPFCTGNPGYHLGYNIKEGFFRCWRCGYKDFYETLEQLTGLKGTELRRLLRQYKGSISDIETEPKTEKLSFSFPSNTTKLTELHKEYLILRGFDPNKLEKEWNLLGTGHVSFLDEKDYKHRIIIPIYWNGKIVSFQSRIIANIEPKYKACPKNREIIHHKHILYGKQRYWNDKRSICVEGVFDVWRFGYKSFATFGIGYTKQQVCQIAKHFKEVVIVYDCEDQAQEQAKKLKKDLALFGVKTYIENVLDDPASMSQAEADEFVRSILRKYWYIERRINLSPPPTKTGRVSIPAYLRSIRKE